MTESSIINNPKIGLNFSIYIQGWIHGEENQGNSQILKYDKIWYDMAAPETRYGQKIVILL